jgi:3-deoxy-D-manno-octulosonate 8-phosphate phosphatase (KDO 8-P phosphatase)
MYRLRSKKIIFEKAKSIKLILLDVDGVLTDGAITYGKINEEPVEIKSFDVHDGYGIVKAIERGIAVGIITARNSHIVSLRAQELGITDVYQGSFNKIEAYEDVKKKHNVSDSDAAFMGDDLFDIPVLRKVGLSAAPSNARPEVKRKVDIVTKAEGGKGAVREFIDLIFKAQGYGDMVE